jgi:hypothetical protein
MNRVVSILGMLLLASSASAADRSPDPEQISIATTGRILKVDTKNRTLKVRGSDPGIANVAQTTQGPGLMQRLGLSLPRSIRIEFPGLNGKRTPKQTSDTENNLEEYTVIITNDTLIQDGSDPIRLEDFKVGETISIHGVLQGKTLKASRIAKWS